MGFADYYFRKFDARERLIAEPVAENLSQIVTIPCFKEKNIIKALRSLYFCQSTKGLTEVIVILNYPQQLEAEQGAFHKSQYLELLQWTKEHTTNNLHFYIVLLDLPPKDAGVGLARKIAMDEALRRFNDIDKHDGIIAGFDADCLCSPNYLQCIECGMESPSVNGCSVYFEHPVSGLEYSTQNYEAIIFYEIYLRYYVEALRMAGFPYAYHTLGSSFAVKANAYAKQGGMNKRKAGEDFYFLHKIIPLGGFVEINECTVYPSPRESDRVPFGTGAAVNKIMQFESADYPTFCLEAFEALRTLFSCVNKFFKIRENDCANVLVGFHISLQGFLKSKDFYRQLQTINSNCAHIKAFEKAFYSWFNGLMVLQYLNEAHVSYFQKINMSSATRMLLRDVYGITEDLSALELLGKLRDIQNPIRLRL